tara:strand:+ start:452 stop:598 length:147 start_codon:yes stop_codon:yes gene_type:complete
VKILKKIQNHSVPELFRNVEPIHSGMKVPTRMIAIDTNVNHFLLLADR